MLKPAGRRGHHRRIEAARGDADQPAEQQLKLQQGVGTAGRDQAKAEKRAAQQHDDARSVTVRQHTPDEGSRTHEQKVERRGRRNARAGPARLGRQRLQKDAERKHRSHADAGHQHTRTDNDPPVSLPHASFGDTPTRSIVIAQHPLGAAMQDRSVPWMGDRTRGAKAASPGAP
jgi:hypothetical protein